jgi:hypothetical protein
MLWVMLETIDFHPHAAQLREGNDMEANSPTTLMTPCGGPLPELEVPMINTVVACLRVEHRKLNELNMKLAYNATRLARWRCD